MWAPLFVYHGLLSRWITPTSPRWRHWRQTGPAYPLWSEYNPLPVNCASVNVTCDSHSSPRSLTCPPATPEPRHKPSLSPAPPATPEPRHKLSLSNKLHLASLLLLPAFQGGPGPGFQIWDGLQAFWLQCQHLKKKKREKISLLHRFFCWGLECFVIWKFRQESWLDVKPLHCLEC